MTARASKISPSPVVQSPSPQGGLSRTISADPGLLSNEELLAQSASATGRRRRTLEELIAKEQLVRIQSSGEKASAFLRKAKRKVRWFIEHAQIKISVSASK